MNRTYCDKKLDSIWEKLSGLANAVENMQHELFAAPITNYPVLGERLDAIEEKVMAADNRVRRVRDFIKRDAMGGPEKAAPVEPAPVEPALTMSPVTNDVR